MVWFFWVNWICCSQHLVKMSKTPLQMYLVRKLGETYFTHQTLPVPDIITCNWYSKTGISSVSVGPNCLLAAEKRIATVKANFRLIRAILVIYTLPPDKAPRDAPKRFLGSWKRQKRHWWGLIKNTAKTLLLVIYKMAVWSFTGLLNCVSEYENIKWLFNCTANVLTQNQNLNANSFISRSHSSSNYMPFKCWAGTENSDRNIHTIFMPVICAALF